MKRYLLFLLFFLFTSQSFAQYEGYFNDIFFNRSFSAQSAALGRSSKAIPDDAFSVHQNSALLGFQNGYSLSYAHSSPFYTLKDATFDYIGLSGKIFDNWTAGASHINYNTGQPWGRQLSTLATVYKPRKNLLIGGNLRHFRVDYGDRTSEQGVLIDEAIYKQVYVDITASLRVPFHLPFVHKSSTTLGFTFENPFQQSISRSSNFKIQLPSTVTLGAYNEFSWKKFSGFLTDDLSLGLLAEYREVLNYKYRSKLSFGAEINLNKILILRGGYFLETVNDYGYEKNKSQIRDFTFGLGTNIPLANLLKLEHPLVLSIDVIQMQQPLYTRDNIFDIGRFITVSSSLTIDL